MVVGGATRGRQRGFLQRMGRNGVRRQDTINRIPDKNSSSLESNVSDGPVCVDDFLVKHPSPAVVKKQPYFSSNVIDLDKVVVTDEDDSSGFLNSSIETSSSSSTDDSYQADLPGKKRVTFSNVSMRVYSVTVSDSPNPSSTYPMGLGWNYEERAAVELEAFEETKSNAVADRVVVLSRGFRRPKRLSPLDRFHRISELSGLSYGEIYELEHARSSHQRQLPPESSLLARPSSTVPSNQSYQIVDVDSGYQCVDV